MDNLKNRESVTVDDIVIDHKNNVFMEDGIVCPETWFKESDKPKILLLLKEAYTTQKKDAPLVEWLNDDDSRLEVIRSRTWGPVSQWVYGIHNTTVDKKADFEDYVEVEGLENQYVREIAVVNIKKSQGTSLSSPRQLKAYAEADSDYLKAQIELINPDIIISGHVGGYFNTIFKEDKIKTAKNVWWHKTDLNEKEIIVITGYHPSKRTGTYKEKFNETIDAYYDALQ